MGNAFSHMNPGFMTWNTAPMMLLTFIIIYKIICCITGWGADSEDDEGDQLVEGLAEYYDALKAGDKSALIGHEDTLGYKYGCKTFSDEQFYKLQRSETADLEKIIMGVATYRILDSLEYQQALQYEPVRKKDDGTSSRDNVILITT